MRRVPAPEDAPTLSEGDGIRYLHFGTEWIQGAMAVREPSLLVLEYTRQMMAWRLFVDPPRKPQAIGILGLGSASLARFCLKRLNSTLHVVEWNPQVVAVCEMYFRFKANQRRVSVWCQDAAEWVADPEHHDTCPVLLVDLYDAKAQGPVRGSLAFYRDCRKVMGETGGVLSVNLFGTHASFGRHLDRLNKAFDGRVVLLPEIEAGNRIALAFTGEVTPLEPEPLLAQAELVESELKLPARRWARSLLGQAR